MYLNPTSDSTHADHVDLNPSDSYKWNYIHAAQSLEAAHSLNSVLTATLCFHHSFMFFNSFFSPLILSVKSETNTIFIGLDKQKILL